MNRRGDAVDTDQTANDAGLAAGLSLHANIMEFGQAGQRIVWRRWGSGPHVVLLHGSAGSWNHWLRNIAALAATHTVHAVDLPGCGESDADVGPPDIASMAGRLASSFEALDPQAGTYDLVGFSFGSVVAEEWALSRPENVRRVVLVRGSFDGSTPATPAGLVKWRHLTDPGELREAHRHNLAALMFHDPAAIDDEAVDLHAANSARARLNPMPYAATRTPGVLERIKPPVTAITGEFDVLSGGRLPAQRLAFASARPEGRFHVIEGAGHWVAYESADAFNSALLQALA